MWCGLSLEFDDEFDDTEGRRWLKVGELGGDGMLVSKW